MTFEEAESIRLMIDGNWNLHMNEHTAELWRSTLIDDDAESAVAVVAHLAKKMHYPPKIVDYREVMRLLHPPQEPPPLMPLPDEGKRGIEAPEWVWVWSWARYHRDPREERPFPQQSGHVDETEMMTMVEYDELLMEWMEAGSPKAKNPIPLVLHG